MRNLSSSTEKNVRMILSLTAHDTDASVRSAGERVVAHLIDGTLSECDVEAVSTEHIDACGVRAEHEHDSQIVALTCIFVIRPAITVPLTLVSIEICSDSRSGRGKARRGSSRT